jgi:DNA-binding CsgD family transcriptional regulator
MVGRESQMQAADAFIARLADGAHALVVRGEPGIGKTLLWDATTARLEGAGILVLSCRPSEAEVKFAFGALRDVLAPVLDKLDAIPEPLARAVRVALLLEGPGDDPVEAGAVESGTLALLRVLAEEQPLVLAIDDVQWLDAGSHGTLAYVLRRLRGERIGLLATERVEPGESRNSWIAQAMPREQVEEISLPPLSLGAIHHLVRSRLGLSLARPRLVRLHEVSGGNPFYALEIAGAWQQAPEETSVELPETLRGLVGRRLRRLPLVTRRVLVAVALALSTEIDERRLEEVLQMSGAALAEALEPALAARVVTGGRGRLQFVHPLVAAAAVEGASPATIARMHDRLAQSSASVEERARHLSLAREPQDAEVAGVLDDAAAAAAGRGAATDAAEFRALAVRFSPDDDPLRSRRVVDLGEALFIAGDIAQARSRITAALEGVQDHELRIESLVLLATVIWYDGQTDNAISYAERALAEAGDDRDALAQIHARMSWLCDTDVPKARQHAAAALALLDPDREPARYAFALLNDAHLRLQLGEAADHDAIERGYRLQETASIWEFSTLPGNWTKAMDDFATARQRLEMYLGRVRAQGDESSIAQILGYLAELEAWTGNLARARDEADEAAELAEETGQRGYLIQALRHRALTGVLGGDLEGARADSARALLLAEELGDPVLLPGALGIQALISLTDGDLAAVDELCTRATGLLDGIGMRDHAAYRFHADHIEALIGLGQLERAGQLLERHAARGQLGPRPWILATAARCDALLRSARGDPDGAFVSITTAREQHATLEMPFEYGRTLLVEGQIARRTNHRRDAVAALGAARDQFDRLGSRQWAERADKELSRVGIRRGRGDELTPTELSVARLAGGGLTNREVASALFISPKTVEANLSRAYAKLGIRSRAELGAVMAEGTNVGKPPMPTAVRRP